jgi:hypothetical protein
MAKKKVENTSVIGTSAPLEQEIPHANKMSEKQQLLAHAEKVEKVIEYFVLSEKDGVHSAVTTLPSEFSDLITLWKAGAISKHQAAIISVIIRESAERLEAYHKALEEKQKRELGFTEKKILTP